MHYDDSSRRLNLVGGFLVGAILGAGLALLAAPPKRAARARRAAGRTAKAIRRRTAGALDGARDRAAAGAKAIRRFQL